MSHVHRTTPDTAHHPPEPREGAARKPGLLLAVLCLAQFMLVLDVTVVNVALPDMAADLALGRETLTWVVTAYTLCFGGLMLLGGRLADILGAHRTVLAGLAVFTAASLVSGLATGAPMLLTGRTLQGAGAALMSPAALSIVTTAFHGEARNKALGVWAAIGGTGSAVGVLLGGALTDGPGWKWVFYINVPVGALALAVLPGLLPKRPTRPARLDVPGALLATAGTGSLIYGLVKAGDTGWGSTAAVLPMLGSLLLYGAFVAVERVSRAPLTDLRLFTRRPVVAGVFLMLTASALLIASFFLGSVYLQHVRGLSPLRTGLVFLPVAVATGLGAHLGSRLVGRIGSRATAVAGLAVGAAGTVPLAALSSGGGVYTVLLPGLAVASFGFGAVLVTATTTALAMVAHEEAGLASGVINTFHEVGGSIGVAVMSTAAASGIDHGTAAGFADAFTVGVAVAAAGALVALVLVPRGKPQVMPGMAMH
ncbi:DHA2 family efflux MFS transporter permease subunit [Streptomyces sp. NPDC101209]|uniref:DHA2 family efflux MFS transporter permease subunit n=1 Tax=Streptomyces sp. NPDC101209 TaxID=3366129 RepID=UPI00380198BE